mmetsp:Transcript_1924/g.2597  ORF Transcript_1924/g.2597 Transcript_1924/m.2597 type:complete len:201 (-) Transcript_1924:175-777(-)
MNKFCNTLLLVAICASSSTDSVLGFAAPRTSLKTTFVSLRAESPESTSPVDVSSSSSSSSTEIDPMDEEIMDADSRLALEKARRADELRAQEVFMKKSTGLFDCSNCDWEYDESKGDAMMIGGMIQPGTSFEDLPSNWRCPVCRASKDSFREKVIEIPGFEVNQGYGLGGNSMTSDQKNGIIFGGLLVFFVLFLSGYALS